MVGKFGGLAKMRDDTGIPGSTIWKWLTKGYIPNKRVPEIKDHALRLKVKLKDADFIPAASAA